MIATVVIPAFNRIGPLCDTLSSAYLALETLEGQGEVILVDDGSVEPLKNAKLPRPRTDQISLAHHRQTNSGSVVARLTGLSLARGHYVQFLDSDDLIAPEKLALQIAAMDNSGAVMSVGTLVSANRAAGGHMTYGSVTPTPPLDRPLVEWLLLEQPPPHLPVYNRAWLNETLGEFIVSQDRRTDPAGDIWLYVNLCLGSGTVVHVPGARAAIGIHEELRFSQQWERLAFSSLMISESFMAATRDAPRAEPARRCMGIAAIRSWRRLPKDFVKEYQNRLLAIWRQAPEVMPDQIDGKQFAKLAKVFGVERAAWWLRFLRGHRYASCRTVTDSELDDLLLRSRAA